MGTRDDKSVVTATAAGVVVEGSSNLKVRRWQFIGVVVSAAVLAIALGGVTRWAQQYWGQRDERAHKVIAEKVSDIQNTALSGGYKEAHDQIDTSLKKPGISDNEKYSLLFQEGLTYENEKKYDDAIKSYKAAGELQNVQAVAEALARVAENKGDKQMAITYYKKAITLIPPDRPIGPSDKKHYEEAIVRLGGQV